MKKNSILTALCFWTVVIPCSADTFTLKDGSVVEGSVVREEGDVYVVEVQVTKSIKDERRIPKADVGKLDRPKPDLTAFAPIEKMVPTPDFLAYEAYPPKIAEVNKFIKDFPGSPKVKDAKAILETLKAEASAISSGGLKFSGKIVSSVEYEANAYDLDARVAERKIRALVDSEQTLAALRAFSEFDRDYRTTLAYSPLAPFMSQVIKNYLEETRASLATLEARTKARQAGLQQMAPSDRSDTITAIKEEDDAIEARYQAEKSAKQDWPTTSPYHKASHEDTIKYAEQQLTRLASVKTELGVDGGKTYREAYRVVHGGAKPDTVASALAAAKAAGIPARYLEPLEAQAKAANPTR